jgi:ABC-2 type transport system ATP-binding protein
LNEVMHKPVHELSKGFKQRVGLAHAMMGDPEILVLDEPTSGLDPNQIVEIRDIIRRIGREKTVVLSTHILSEAEATCDRVVIINRGRIVADGATESLKRDAGRSYSIHLTLAGGDGDSIRQELEALSEVDAVRCNDDESEGALTLRLNCRTDRDLRPAVYDLVRRNDWPLLELYRESRTLETIFRELTKED